VSASCTVGSIVRLRWQWMLCDTNSFTYSFNDFKIRIKTVITDCTSCCISNGQRNGKMRFSTTHSGKTSGPILIKLTIITTHRRPPGMQTLTSIRRCGWSGGIASFPLSFFFLFLFSLPRPQVALCVGSGQMRAQNASYRARNCLFGARTTWP